MDRQMKRYFATVFALFMILGCLSACSNGKEYNGETTGPIGHPVEAEVTTAADTADYDSNGGIILSSTTDRYVYRTPDGYLAITFNDRTALQVLIIREYETAEAASKVYMDEYAVSGADGECAPCEQVRVEVQPLAGRVWLPKAAYYRFVEQKTAASAE